MISKLICLESYSTSEGWLGYISGLSNDLDVNVIISYELIKHILGDVCMYSSLTVDPSRESRKDFWGLDERQEGCISKLNVNNTLCGGEVLSIVEFSKEVADSVNYLVFSSYVLEGHIFYTDKNNDIFIYPHDEGGIGFVLNNESLRDSYLSSINDFVSSKKGLIDFIANKRD